jgi:adenosylmethionine-8-amino-7-oxononanoate aminotransferase
MHDHAGDAPPLPLLPIKSADGVWLEDYEGKQYLDAVSSWWTNIFGHRHPHIVESLKAQLDQLDHVLLAGFTHQPAVELAERLSKLTGLDKCLYADNGSSAVEAALKMSFHYWLNRGQVQKKKFITLANSYHGETLGALAMGDTGLYRETYAPLLMQRIVVPSPDCYSRSLGESWEDYSRQQFRHLQTMLEQQHEEVCAVIVEPLVQCAGGMRMYHHSYLQLLRAACDKFKVHFIADEIAVGFGRTGKMFACEWAKVTPDFLCLSKGITGGTLPLSAVLTRDGIYEAFYAEHAQGKAFLHSHSYTGNPLACRAALATLDLFAQFDVMTSNRKLAQMMWEGTADLRAHPRVAEVRQQGMILAIEMAKNPRTREAFPPSERRGLRAYRHALGQGVVLRPLGDVIYFMPPYVITPREVELMCRVATEAVTAATAD